jgi:hypothetical protein
MIIDVANETCVQYPSDKFWRINEIKETLVQNLPDSTDAEIVEKVDGSMVSCFRRNGEIEFQCKGNFNTEQSLIAKEISKIYPKFDQLNFDRYWYTFEVVYPENRFPQGLSVVDYGDERKLVLIAMRDKLTNEMLSYDKLIEEARRVEVPYPKMYSGTFEDLMQETSNKIGRLTDEGYVVRFANGYYIKVKYLEYMLVLPTVNHLNAGRFVKKYLAMTATERTELMNVLPLDFKEKAQKQLDAYNQVFEDIEDYLNDYINKYDRDNFPIFVQDHAPPEFKKALVMYWKGGYNRSFVERIALKIYEGSAELPKVH